MKCVYVKLLSIPLAAAFAALPAYGADLYAPGVSAKDAPMYDAVPNWTGFYLGVNGGYGWGAARSTLSTAAIDNGVLITALPPAGDTSKFWTSGGFGGGQLGYNLQRDRFVFGIEADIQSADITGKAFSESVTGNITTDAWVKSRLDWFGTVRGRLGYSYGGSLIYATGGFAYGGVRDSLIQTVNATAAGSDGRNATLTGYTVGGGLEYALTPVWSVKAEYQYINLGTVNLAASNDVVYGSGIDTGTGTGSSSAKLDHTYHTVRLGLNYKINQVYEPLK